MLKKIKEKIIGLSVLAGIWLFAILIIVMIIFSILNKMGFRFVIRL